MLSQLFEMAYCPTETREIKPSYKKLNPTPSIVDGQLVRETEFVEFNPVKENVNFLYTDFSIGNLLAVGALGNMKPVSVHSITDFTFVDSFAKSVSDVSKA